LISLCEGSEPHTVEKLSTRATTLLKISSQSEVYTQSYGPPKLREFQLWEFQDSHLGQNDIWVLVPWPGIERTIRRKVMVSPKSGPWGVLWIRVGPWFVHAPKCSNYALTNLLFGLCKSMWVIELLVNLSSSILELQHGPLPPKCFEPGSTPQLLLLLLSSPSNSQLNPSRRVGVRQFGYIFC